MAHETLPGSATTECPACRGYGRVPLHPASQETTGLAQPARAIIPLSAHATATKLRISTSPTCSVRPISAHVKEPDGTAWRVLSMTVDGIVRWYGDPPFPACRGNCWIDLEVECPHDHPPTEAKPLELCGVVLCEASDLPVSAGDTERDRQWAMDFRKPRGAQKLSNGEWETTFRGDASPLHPSTAPQDTHVPDHESSVDRDPKLLKLRDAARQLVEVSDSVPRFHGHHGHAMDALEVAARAWMADECPICGRRGDHEWDELTITERAAHLAEAAAQGT